MEFEKFDIGGPVLCKPKIIKDERGFFAEVFRKDLLEDFINEKLKFKVIEFSKENKKILVSDTASFKDELLAASKKRASKTKSVVKEI